MKYLTPQAVELIKNSLKSKTIGTRDKDNKLIEELSKVYEGRISDLLTQIEYLKKESDSKNELLKDKDKLLDNNNELMKNMQVLLHNFNKKQIVENIEQNKKWWRFWDKKK